MTPTEPSILWLLIGPNGAGKSTYYRTRVAPRLRAPFINAGRIQASELPGSGVEASYEAARRAALRREALLASGRSFVTETVASHPSKLELLRAAQGAGYRAFVVDNSTSTEPLRTVLVVERGRVTWRSPSPPSWVPALFPLPPSP